MSNEINQELATKRLARMRMRFKVTVVGLGVVVAAVACAIKVHLGDSYLKAVPTALLTYQAIFITGFFLDLIIFRSG